MVISFSRRKTTVNLMYMSIKILNIMGNVTHKFHIDVKFLNSTFWAHQSV